MKDFKIECLYPCINLSTYDDTQAPLAFHFSYMDKQVCVCHNSLGFAVKVQNFIPDFSTNPLLLNKWIQVTEYFSTLEECLVYYKMSVLSLLRIKYSFSYTLDDVPLCSVFKTDFVR